MACENGGGSISDHFAETGKMIELAKGAQREVTDYALTRYACYLVAQNGDASKSEIARDDHMQTKPAENSLPPQTPTNSSESPAVEMP